MGPSDVLGAEVPAAHRGFSVTPPLHDVPMTTAQLQLVPGTATSPWRLSNETRRIGRAGIAEARAALAAREAAATPEADDSTDVLTLPFAA